MLALWLQPADQAIKHQSLATGACGSVFANDTLYNRWGIWLIIYGILVVIVCITFIGWLAVIRRWYNTPPVSSEKAIRNVLIGGIPVGLITALLILGYTYRVEG